MQPRKTKGALRLTTFFHRFQLVAPRLLMLIACGLLSVVVPAQSWSGGLYITEFGTPSNGVANAGAVALANDASTAWHNPAGLSLFPISSLILIQIPLCLVGMGGKRGDWRRLSGPPLCIA
jgi:hypothetical protein